MRLVCGRVCVSLSLPLLFLCLTLSLSLSHTDCGPVGWLSGGVEAAFPGGQVGHGRRDPVRSAAALYLRFTHTHTHSLLSCSLPLTLFLSLSVCVCIVWTRRRGRWTCRCDPAPWPKLPRAWRGLRSRGTRYRRGSSWRAACGRLYPLVCLWRSMDRVCLASVTSLRYACAR
jgi:hypothetical protein